MQMQCGEMTCTIEEEAGRPRLLRCDGDLCLPAVDGLRRILLQALEDGRDTVADMSGVRLVDLAGLQLLYSAHRSFQHAGRCFRLRDVPESFRRTAFEAGLRRDGVGCDWLGEL